MQTATELNGSKGVPPLMTKPPRQRIRKKPAAPVSLQQLLDELRAAGAAMSQADEARGSADDVEGAQSAFDEATRRHDAVLERFESAPIRSLADVATRLLYATKDRADSSPHIGRLHQAVVAACEAPPLEKKDAPKASGALALDLAEVSYVALVAQNITVATTMIDDLADDVRALGYPAESERLSFLSDAIFNYAREISATFGSEED